METNPKKILRAGFEKSLKAQMPLAQANVKRLRRVHPKKDPKEVADLLDKYYLRAVTSTGAASGATAVAPGSGVPAALVDMLAFTEASVFYVLSLAEVHDLHAEDFERRKLLVQAILIGDAANSALNKAIGRIGPHWAKRIVKSIPMTAINKANKALAPRFITKYGEKQGVLVLSKQLPFGIGIITGGASSRLIGKAIVRSAHKAFGPAPKKWPVAKKKSAKDVGPVILEPIDASTSSANGLKYWDRLQSGANEAFETATGLPFTYAEVDGGLQVNRTDRDYSIKLSRDALVEAVRQMPVGGPGELRGVQGASYVWAILMDPRIRGDDW